MGDQLVSNLIVVGEGQTEESFSRDVLGPELFDHGVFVYPRLIRTSTYGRGGALRWNRVRLFLRNTLRERPDTYVTSFFDLYKLDRDFPGWNEANALLNPIDRAAQLERHFHAAVVAEANCREDRFIPHIQPYEFEALIFSNVDVLADIEAGWTSSLVQLRNVRAAVETPEHINDGEITHPSARLESALHPPYQKVLHGVSITRRIGLTRMRQECLHFASWVTKLETLPPLL